MKVDDPVGAISAHGTAGIWGLIAVAFTNADATIGVQLYGTVVIFLWTFIAAGITWGILKVIMGIRVSKEAEGSVDVSECGMEAYPRLKNKLYKLCVILKAHNYAPSLF